MQTATVNVNSVNVNSVKNLATMTVKVKVTGVWLLRFRINIAILLIKLAGLIASSNVKVEEEK